MLHIQVREKINKGEIVLTPSPQQQSDTQHKKNNHSQQTSNNTPSSNHNTVPVPVTILGDSNLKFFDPSKMMKSCHFEVIEAKSTQALNRRVQETRIKGKVVVVHTGTNNLYNNGPVNTAQNIITSVDELITKKHKVVISKLLPREGDLLTAVNTTNEILAQHYRYNRNVKITNNDKFYYYDQPNDHLYTREQSGSRKLPLLHVNRSGLIELSRQIQWCTRQLLSQKP